MRLQQGQGAAGNATRATRTAYNRGVSRTRTVLESMGVLLLLALVCLYAASPIFSVDFFWHLKLGEVLRETGQIPRTDMFSSVHPERPYVQFNWLWELGAAWIEGAFGLRGIRVAQSVVLGLSFGLLYAASRRAFASGAFALGFCALALVLFEDRFRARPSALALGFFAAMLPMLLDVGRERSSLWRDEATRSRARTGMLLATLSLSALWSNLHGGESVLLVLSLGAVLAGELCHRYVLGRPDAAAKPALQLLIAALLGFLSSPTLIDGFAHWLSAVGPQIETGNEEWQPSVTMLANGWRPAFILIGLGPTAVALAYGYEQLARVRREGRSAIDAREWLLCAGYLVLSHHAVRNAFLCLLPLAFMLQRYSLLRSGALQQRDAPPAADARSTAIAIGLALVLLGVSFEDAVLRGYGGLERARKLIALDLAPGVYPERVATFIDEAGIRGRAINDGKLGGYLIWRSWPQVHVFADSRHNLTPEMWPIFLQSHHALERPIALRDGFARYGLELSVFHAPTFPLHVPPAGWRLLFKAGGEELYQHERGEHARANVAATRTWLAKHGAPIRDDASAREMADATTRVGAAQWLRAPYQALRMREATSKTMSTAAATRAAGHTDRGVLLWEAGLYEDAARDLDAALALAPRNAAALYHAALSRFATGELERVRERLNLLVKLQKQLTPTQRARMAMLATAISPRP